MADLFDVVVARKLSGGGGGGGSSDFSTAEVTLVNTSGTFLGYIYLAHAADIRGVQFLNPYIDTSESDVFNAVLYKGKAYMTIPTNVSIEIVGSFQDMGTSDVGHGYLITGDCTITITSQVVI